MIRLMMVALLSLAWIGVAHSDNAYRLKGDVDVKADAISLADLVEGPHVPNDPVFSAPALGKTGTIQAARIAAAFKKLTGETLILSTDTPVNVTRRARIISEADLADAIGKLAERDYKIEQAEIRLQWDKEAPGIAVEQDATGAILISNLKIDPQTLRFETQISVGDSAALIAHPAQLRGYIVADRLVPVINHAVDKGASLSSNDIRLERRLRSTLVGRTFVAMSDLHNRVALTNLVPGDLVTDDVVGRPQLVEKGSFVTVAYESSGLSVSMRGRANESGALGDVISFSNPQSKKTLFGTVVASGQLRVTTYAAKEARLQSGNAADTP